MLRLAYGAPQLYAAGTLNRTEIQIVVAARVTVKAQGVDARLSVTKGPRVLLYQQEAETNTLVRA